MALLLNNLRNDTVGKWVIDLSDRKHIVEFEHGTVTGKRVIWLDGIEVYRKNLVFELLGSVSFTVLENQLTIHITENNLHYVYSLTVNGVDLEKFSRRQSKVMRTWTVHKNDQVHRVVLERDSLDVWVDGIKVQTDGEFDDEGTKTHFKVDGFPAYLKATSSGNKKDGIVHTLYFKDLLVALNTD